MLINQRFVTGMSGCPVVHKGYSVDDDGEIELLVVEDGVEHALCWLTQQDLETMLKELKKAKEDV